MESNFADTITEKSRVIHKANTEKGFYEAPDSVLGKMAHNDEFTAEDVKQTKQAFTDQRIDLVVCELSEAVEAARKSRFCGLYSGYFSPPFQDDKAFKADFQAYVKDTFEDELADAMIRLLDLCGWLDIDIGWHIEQKLRYNALRPYKHGKSY